MPRVPPRDIIKANRIHPLLGKLIGVCRTIEASKRELYWMEDEVLCSDAQQIWRLIQKYRIPFQALPSDEMIHTRRRGKWEKILLQKLVDERSKGTPLQLVVENQPFGNLSIHVRPGVFVPRWETEEWTLALAARLRKLTPSRQAFTLVDLCTGSGCIPLLLKDFVSAEINKNLYPKYGKANHVAKFIGVEKSAVAVEVAQSNLKRIRPTNQLDSTTYFIKSDIQRLPPAAFQGRVDIITCNPPYIPLSSRPTLDRSVTKYEPSEALFAPSKYGDDYYYFLRATANRWETPVVVMEVGDLEQAERVKSYFEQDNQWKSSIWLDSAGKGRVVVAVKSEKWAFLLPQPDYSVPLDLTPFPKQERSPTGPRGIVLSMFHRPKLITPEIPPSKTTRKEKEKSKENGDMGFVERMLEKLRINFEKNDRGEQSGFIKYLENLKKISK